MINYKVPTGMIIKEYMEVRKITKDMLVEITNTSEEYVLEIINGETPITKDFALKLEKVFPDVDALFWLELEAQYQTDKLREV